MLLSDRGWSQSTICFSYGESPVRKDLSTQWDAVTREEIEEAARSVVGSDAAYADYTAADMTEAHWWSLAATLAKQGIPVDPTDLEALPHEVVLSDRLLARLGDPPNQIA
jgi:hypothetical protein